MRLGKYKIKKEQRTIHTGIGFRTGCGYNFSAKYFTVYKSGICVYERILSLDYELDIDQIKSHSEAFVRLKKLEDV